MKAAFMFISALLIVDTFLVSFAYGFNSRHVLVVDPSLPPVTQKAPDKPNASADKSNEAKDAGKGSSSVKTAPAQTAQAKTAAKTAAQPPSGGAKTSASTPAANGTSPSKKGHHKHSHK